MFKQCMLCYKQAAKAMKREIRALIEHKKSGHAETCSMLSGCTSLEDIMKSFAVL